MINTAGAPIPALNSRSAAETLNDGVKGGSNSLRISHVSGMNRTSSGSSQRSHLGQWLRGDARSTPPSNRRRRAARAPLPILCRRQSPAPPCSSKTSFHHLLGSKRQVSDGRGVLSWRRPSYCLLTSRPGWASGAGRAQRQENWQRSLLARRQRHRAGRACQTTCALRTGRLLLGRTACEILRSAPAGDRSCGHPGPRG